MKSWKRTLVKNEVPNLSGEFGSGSAETRTFISEQFKASRDAAICSREARENANRIGRESFKQQVENIIGEI